MRAISSTAASRAEIGKRRPIAGLPRPFVLGADEQLAFRQIDVAPLQRQQLPAAAAGLDRADDHALQERLGDGEQTPFLPVSDDRPLVVSRSGSSRRSRFACFSRVRNSASSIGLRAR